MAVVCRVRVLCLLLDVGWWLYVSYTKQVGCCLQGVCVYAVSYLRQVGVSLHGVLSLSYMRKTGGLLTVT